jgi:hypothetical protein
MELEVKKLFCSFLEDKTLSMFCQYFKPRGWTDILTDQV